MIVGAKGVKDVTGKPTETTELAHRNTQSMNQQPGSLHGEHQKPQHICVICVAWSICETPNNGVRDSL